MDIRKLKIFIEVVNEESFTKAAKKLYITQPAISKAILELEQEAQTLLFERFPKKITLTPAGKNLYTKAKRLVVLHDELQDQLPHLEKDATLRIGSSITIANEMLPSLIKQLQNQFKDLHIEIEIAIVPTILQKLEHNEIDIAFVEGVIEENKLISIPFSSYRIFPVCSTLYYQKHNIQTLADLVSHPLLLREKGSAIRDVIDSTLLLNDYKVTPAWTSTNSNALLQATLNDFGISFLPENMIHKKINEGKLKEIEVENLKLENINHLVYKQQKHLNSHIQFLIQIAKAFKK